MFSTFSQFPAAVFRRQIADRVGRALADLLAFKIHAAHARLRGERNETARRQFVDLPRADAKFFRQHDDAAAFGRFVGERRELRGIGEFLFRHATRAKTSVA
jgi:hypothetical protein